MKKLGSICKVAMTNQLLYQLVENETEVPWPLIAAIHFRESNQSFKCHIHNGDTLSARTVHVPIGRPLVGHPPFTWTASAIDALQNCWKPKDWSLARSLEFLEKYNGLGYQKHSINSPYLWDFTDKYEAGLYAQDGKFDPNKKESRPGCVAILKSLKQRGVSLDFASDTQSISSTLH